MKSGASLVLAALAARQAAGHAIFQQLWVDGVDMCNRMPMSNTPVTNVASPDVRCNAGTKGVAMKCPVKAGSNVTVEMHQQPGDRACGTEAIGGSHYGPVMVYMSKVADASTADGSDGWFKVFEDSWTKAAGAGSGDNDEWGVKDLNACCGRMDVKVPDDIPAGDYLLRAEVIALHTAGSSGGAQLYMSCYQLSVTGGGDAKPDLVKFPGAYAASNPGILVNIHAAMSTYIAPGPTVYPGGTTKVAGSGCGSGCADTCKVGAGSAGTALAAAPAKTEAASSPASTAGAAAPGGAAGAAGAAGAGSAAGCAVQQFQQCGGNGYSGCTSCAAGLSCKDVSPPYYSQCA